MPTLEVIFIITAGLLFLSVAASKISARIGVPSLFLFIGIGILAGSDGPGGIWFDNYIVASDISIMALALILFSGGLETDISEIRPVLKRGAILSTLGVFITAGLVGIFVHAILGLDLMTGMLIGAIISSTDAAAVFGILRTRQLGLPRQLRSLLELESGSNDPMAVFLTIGLVTLVASKGSHPAEILVLFVTQISFGLLAGWGAGRLITFVLRKFRLEYEGLYPIFTIASVLAVYGTTALLDGSGFLAVYIMGIIIGNQNFAHRRSILRFHNATGWLMQIVMFITMGLLVFPHQLPEILLPALGVTFFLIFIARPIAIGLCLFPFRIPLREWAFISWVGLKGAVPIVLGIFPLLHKIPDAQIIFNIVFFVVLVSLILQATSIPWVAKKLGLVEPFQEKRPAPLAFEPSHEISSEMVELELHDCSRVIGQSLRTLGLPEGTLVALIGRAGQYIIPRGDTVLERGDTIFVLAPKGNINELRGHVACSSETCPSGAEKSGPEA